MGTLEILLALFIPVGVMIVLFFLRKKNQHAAYDDILMPSAKKKVVVATVVKDLVFATDSEREKYLLEISKMHDTNIIAWFESDFNYLNRLFGSNWNHSSVKVYLHASLAASEINPDIPMVLWGRHPLASVEYKTLAALPAVSTLVGMTSLDDALIQHFGGDKLKSLMGKMGHKEGEIFEHSMISASIRYAQEDLDKKVKQPISAASANEWFLMNTIQVDKS
jgi:hypothetical protein